MPRKPTYIDPPHTARGKTSLRTGTKKIYGRDGELIVLIYDLFGAQRFTYNEANEALAAHGVAISQTKLASMEPWGWINIVGYTSHPSDPMPEAPSGVSPRQDKTIIKKVGDLVARGMNAEIVAASLSGGRSHRPSRYSYDEIYKIAVWRRKMKAWREMPYQETPRLVYQVSQEIRDRIEAKRSGKKLQRYRTWAVT